MIVACQWNTETKTTNNQFIIHENQININQRTGLYYEQLRIEIIKYSL